MNIVLTTLKDPSLHVLILREQCQMLDGLLSSFLNYEINNFPLNFWASEQNVSTKENFENMLALVNAAKCWFEVRQFN